jgi:AcrR family transcriptional regulator
MVRGRAIDTPGLIAAAAGVFERKGFRNATIDDVAEAAGIARATLYRYADSKQHLLDMIVDAILDDMAAGLQAALRGDGTPRERLRAVRRGARPVVPGQPDLLRDRLHRGAGDVRARTAGVPHVGPLGDRRLHAPRAGVPGEPRLLGGGGPRLRRQRRALDAQHALPLVPAGWRGGCDQLAEHLFRLVDGALAGAAQPAAR